ncbi:hypothetical protein GCM10017044_17910 [Kordiimonas sediminis]|uniref:DUF1285 domain-containing protein n=1 Tax=Kordiimonas sediminis TaxID=1735581 RepID=A0A919ASS2_9PROT|nr:DUF1285 domain-containing protein [Kordiimonas sediminis]GHF23760.1 hypothetical protein GCM10017044_17910 [Kordiimonas sediminis]
MTTKTTLNLEDLMKQVEGQSYPPVDKWNPDFCGDIDMRIARDGTWFYMGTPITRQRMVKLFSTILRKDEDGKTYLVTPVEKVGITVDDAPFVAVRVDAVGEGDSQALHFTTNVGDCVIAGKDNPIRVEVDPETGEPSPYVHVRGRLEALISRAAFYELVDLAETRTKDGVPTLLIKSQGMEFEIGTLEEVD